MLWYWAGLVVWLGFKFQLGLPLQIMAPPLTTIPGDSEGVPGAWQVVE